MDGVVAYILSKKYTKDTAIGMGAIKGAPCQVESINKVGKTTTVTLKWEDDLGASHTQSFDIEDGLDGVSVTGATINSTGHLILTLSNTQTIDCGKVLPQYDTMPTPSSTYLGAIYQYIGSTNVNYTNGYFYKCISDGSGGYIWTQYDVQPTPVTSVNGKTGSVVLDASDVNAQEIIQYNVMPTADSSNVNKVYQYIGTTNLTYTNGYFYRCEYDTDTDTYSWVVANQFALADDVYTKTEIGALSNLPDTNKDVIENIADLNTAINGKEDKFRVTLLPLGSDDLVGKIVQYIGENTSSLVKGYYYQCVKIDEGVYDWVQKNVQPSSGGTGGDGVVEGYYNATNHLFYEDSTFTNPINGESDTLYVSLDTNLLYRYDGGISIFVRVDEGGQGIQVTTMPLADEYQLNKIYQYVGATDSNYTNGYFYKCIYDASEYKWVLTNVQDSYTKDEIGDLSNLPDNTEDVVENIVDIKLSVDQLIASQLTLGDLATNAYYGDKGKAAYDHSQITDGSNPHNTKANNINLNSNITVDGNVKSQVEETLNALNTLAASNKSNKADKVNNATNGNFAGLDASGNLTDSGKKPSDFIEKSSTAGLVKNDGTIDTTEYATVANLANKVDKVSGATANNFAILDSNGNIADSDISKNIIPTNASSSNKVLVRSDIDSALSDASENPVQNKVIALTIDQLQGSILSINDDITGLQDALNDKQDKLTEGNGIDITDSTIALDISYLTASRLGFIPTTEKGSNNGVAELDNTGKVPSSQLPSYVDDVVDGYYYDATHFYEEKVVGGYYNSVDGNFYEDSDFTILITPVADDYYLNIPTGNTYKWDSSTSAYVSATPTRIIGTGGKIYISNDTDIQYRWTGTTFSALGGALQLGETSSTAYRGDRGKIAYDHSQLTSGNPHNVTATEVGLGNVANTGDSDTPVSGGTTKFTTGGAYTELNKKADKVTGATSGNFAGLDANGNLTDSGKKASDFVATSDLDGIYTVNDTPETIIDDNDYFPYLDVSAGTSGEKRKTLWSNIKSVLKTYFDTLYSTVKTSKPSASGGTDLSLVTTGEKYTWDEKVSKSSTTGLLKNDGTVDTTSYATNANLDLKADLADLAETFSDVTAYSIGDYVIYDKDVYRFTASHAAGAWTGSDATKVNISNELKLKANSAEAYLVGDTLTTSIADTDNFPLSNSSSTKYKITWANIKATLKTYFDTLYTGALQWNDL
jgi:hypothetical protein